jgi:hypothetical protein
MSETEPTKSVVPTGEFTEANLRDRAFYETNKQAILAAMKRGELPGQSNYTTGPTGEQ